MRILKGALAVIAAVALAHAALGQGQAPGETQPAEPPAELPSEAPQAPAPTAPMLPKMEVVAPKKKEARPPPTAPKTSPLAAAAAGQPHTAHPRPSSAPRAPPHRVYSAEPRPPHQPTRAHVSRGRERTADRQSARRDQHRSRATDRAHGLGGHYRSDQHLCSRRYHQR